MGLSTHVLDTAHGQPAAGMRVRLWRTEGGHETCLFDDRLDADGRGPSGPLLAGQALRVGTYRLEFFVADYFRARGVALPEPPFLDVVRLDFGLADPAQHYHVPLLASPWSCATYRGS